MNRSVILSLCVLGLLPAAFAMAQSAAPPGDDTATLRKEVQELRQQMEEERRASDARIKALEQKIDNCSQALEAAQKSPDAAQAPGAGQPSSGAEELKAAIGEAQAGATPQEGGAAVAPGGGRAGGIQSFNPDISIVGDFQGHFGKDADKLFVREIELGISGNIDPYLRANSIFSVHPKDDSDEGYDIEIEEAYVSPFNLPYDLQAKLGLFRVGFGKVNEMHQHALPWPDYPLVIRKFFGDDGIAGGGASVSWLVPHTGNVFVELTGQSFHKDPSSLLGGDDANGWVNLVHLKNFLELNKQSTVEFGLTGAAMTGVTVEGADLTYRWRPEKEGKYKSFQWMTEVLASQRNMDGGNVDAWGFYTGPEYQFAERWVAGLRYDYAQDPDNSKAHEQDIGAYLTFRQTEFAYWRLGYELGRTDDPADGSHLDNRVMLQLDWTLGPHPAHKY